MVERKSEEKPLDDLLIPLETDEGVIGWIVRNPGETSGEALEALKKRLIASGRSELK